MQVIPFEKSYTDEWEAFVRSSDNGTIFHTRKFLSYHSPGKFRDNSLLFYENKKLISVLTGAKIKRSYVRGVSYKDNFDTSEKITYISHQGASYGGFVFNDKLSLKQASNLVESLVQYCRDENYERIVLTHPTFVYQKKYSNYIDFALIINNFDYLKREVSSTVRLDVSVDDIFSLYKAEARTATRRSQKLGIVIKESDDWDKYYKILQSNLALRHGVQPAHSLDELKKLNSLFDKDIVLLGAYLEDKMIAGVVNFYCNDMVVLVFYISHDPEYQNYRAVNLLFYETMKKSIRRGIKYLDFGLFTVNMDPNWGLCKFKENFGARGILRDMYYLDL